MTVLLQHNSLKSLKLGMFIINLTFETPDIMIVLFFLGDFSFCFADSLSCRMATSATGSVPFNTSNSERKVLKSITRNRDSKQKNFDQSRKLIVFLKQAIPIICSSVLTFKILIVLMETGQLFRSRLQTSPVSILKRMQSTIQVNLF